MLSEKLSGKRQYSDLHPFDETIWRKWLKQMGNAEGGRVRKKADAEREKEAIYLMQCAWKSGV